MSEKTPLVSVLTLAYNQAPYIRECLNGILMQKTNFAFELLIHDDASTDGTADIIREYEAKYPDIIKPIYQKENQYTRGGKIMERFMYPRAKGKYIALCEGDDYWTDPLKLQKQVDFMEANPEYSLCFHACSIKFEDGITPKKLYSEWEERDYSCYEILKEWTIPTVSSLFRKEILEKGYYKYITNKNIIYGDNILFSFLATYGKVRNISTQEMSVYRRNCGSVINKSINIDKYHKHFNVIRLYVKDEAYKFLTERYANYIFLKGISKLKQFNPLFIYFIIKAFIIYPKSILKYIKSKI